MNLKSHILVDFVDLVGNSKTKSNHLCRFYLFLTGHCVGGTHAKNAQNKLCFIEGNTNAEIKTSVYVLFHVNAILYFPFLIHNKLQFFSHGARTFLRRNAYSCSIFYSVYVCNPFNATGLFLYPLKHQKTS